MIFQDSVSSQTTTPSANNTATSVDSSKKQQHTQSTVKLSKKKKKIKDSLALKAKADSLQLKLKTDSLLIQAAPKQEIIVEKPKNIPPYLLDPNREGSYTAYFSMKTLDKAPTPRPFSVDDLKQVHQTTKPVVDSLTLKKTADSTAIADTTSIKDSSLSTTITDSSKIAVAPSPATTNKMHTSTVQKYVPRAFRNSWGDTDWMLWYIISTFILLIVARFTYKKYLQQIFVAAANIHVTNRLFRERNSLTARTSLYLNALFCFNAGLFAYQIINHFSIPTLGINGFFTTLIISSLLIFIYIGKYIFLNIIGVLFNETELIDEYVHTIFLFNKIAGLLLFPVVIMMPYLKNQYIHEIHIIGFGVTVLIAAYLLRLLRGIVLSLRQNISILYTFLYLCILEFVPLILLLKAVLVVAKYL